MLPPNDPEKQLSANPAINAINQITIHTTVIIVNAALMALIWQCHLSQSKRSKNLIC
ncbi:hypothetical protein Pse7367_2559 [Thalassoporum mexicanum PCC 7367]|nr:hypothetical protein Pse7367_2559 [Pseudanabaena sp. PCC 7367]